jgi:hypothetical protein
MLRGHLGDRPRQRGPGKALGAGLAMTLDHLKRKAAETSRADRSAAGLEILATPCTPPP